MVETVKGDSNKYHKVIQKIFCRETGKNFLS